MCICLTNASTTLGASRPCLTRHRVTHDKYLLNAQPPEPVAECSRLETLQRALTWLPRVLRARTRETSRMVCRPPLVATPPEVTGRYVRPALDEAVCRRVFMQLVKRGKRRVVPPHTTAVERHAARRRRFTVELFFPGCPEGLRKSRAALGSSSVQRPPRPRWCPVRAWLFFTPSYIHTWRASE